MDSSLKTIFNLSLTLGLARLGLGLQGKMQKVLDAQALGSYASEKETKTRLLFELDFSQEGQIYINPQGLTQ